MVYYTVLQRPRRSQGQKQGKDYLVTGYISVFHNQVSGFAGKALSAELECALNTADTLAWISAGAVGSKFRDTGQGHIGSTAFVQQSGFIFRIKESV